MTLPRLVLRRATHEELGEYVPLLPDETVASWARRQAGVHLRSDSDDENTFGHLTIDLLRFPSPLREQLRRAAQPPDEWLHHPRWRKLRCPRCLAEDWSQGRPPYDRRAWCVAWRTCCPRHGRLFEAIGQKALPGWADQLGRPTWTGRNLLAVPSLRDNAPLLNVVLGRDRRAIHLEGALDGKRRGVWFPKGMTRTTLRATYLEIVGDLLHELRFRTTGLEEQQTLPGFNCESIENRFVINVLAEAILSEWTQTPLPMPVMARRTKLLVRTIGWGETYPPFVRPGQVLVRCPTERERPLVHYASLLGAETFAKLPASSAAYHSGYITLPEARVLGMFLRRIVRDLAEMTEQGQFLAFDARRGRVVENPLLLRREGLAGGASPVATPVQVHMIVPAWDLQPPSEGKVELAYPLAKLFPLPPDAHLRRAASLRRWHRKARKGAYFCPAVDRRRQANASSKFQRRTGMAGQPTPSAVLAGWYLSYMNYTATGEGVTTCLAVAGTAEGAERLLKARLPEYFHRGIVTTAMGASMDEEAQAMIEGIPPLVHEALRQVPLGAGHYVTEFHYNLA